VAAVVAGELVVALVVTGALVVTAFVAGALVEAAVVAELRPEIAALIRGYFPKYVKYTVNCFEGNLSFSDRNVFRGKKNILCERKTGIILLK